MIYAGRQCLLTLSAYPPQAHNGLERRPPVGSLRWCRRFWRLNGIQFTYDPLRVRMVVLPWTIAIKVPLVYDGRLSGDPKEKICLVWSGHSKPALVWRPPTDCVCPVFSLPHCPEYSSCWTSLCKQDSPAINTCIRLRWEPFNSRSW